MYKLIAYVSIIAWVVSFCISTYTMSITTYYKMVITILSSLLGLGVTTGFIVWWYKDKDTYTEGGE